MDALDARNPKEEFYSLLAQVNREFKKLRQRCQSLEEENKQLHRQLEEINRQDDDPFGHLSETERYVLRQQIRGLIDKIDQHLTDQA